MYKVKYWEKFYVERNNYIYKLKEITNIYKLND